MPTKLYVAGHEGMVGSAILRRLASRADIVLVTRSHAELDLIDQAAVRSFMERERPDTVILAAARVGGIYANVTYPAEFIYQNLMIQSNVIHQAYAAGVGVTPSSRWITVSTPFAASTSSAVRWAGPDSAWVSLPT